MELQIQVAVAGRQDLLLIHIGLEALVVQELLLYDILVLKFQGQEETSLLL
jgi:hypothetical protein